MIQEHSFGFVIVIISVIRVPISNSFGKVIIRSIDYRSIARMIRTTLNFFDVSRFFKCGPNQVLSALFEPCRSDTTPHLDTIRRVFGSYRCHSQVCVILHGWSPWSIWWRILAYAISHIEL